MIKVTMDLPSGAYPTEDQFADIARKAYRAAAEKDGISVVVACQIRPALPKEAVSAAHAGMLWGSGFTLPLMLLDSFSVACKDLCDRQPSEAAKKHLRWLAESAETLLRSHRGAA